MRHVLAHITQQENQLTLHNDRWLRPMPNITGYSAVVIVHFIYVQAIYSSRHVVSTYGDYGCFEWLLRLRPSLSLNAKGATIVRWITWFELCREVMVIYIISVNDTYQRRRLGMPYVLSTSYVQAALGQDGVANKMFLSFVFGDKRCV
jgi:hypothetical protein